MRKVVEPYRYALFETAIGICGIVWSRHGIAGIQFPEKTQRLTRARLQERFGETIEESAPTVQVKSAVKSIANHLQGKFSNFSDIELDLNGLPPFHKKVYIAARQVPIGRTVSYGDLARSAGSPAAARAVGQAMARNPFALIVPCHRIMGHDGSSVGFSAFGGCSIKEKLLSMEGVSPGKKSPKSKDEPAGTSRRERKYLPAGQTADAGKKVAYAPALKKNARCPFNSTAAIAHISNVDKRMGRLIEKVGDFRLELDEMLTPFEALAESIVYQQLTGKAAATIFARVKALYGGKLPAAKVIVNTPDEQLRACGLSTAKTLAFKDLADKQHRGLIPTLDQLETMDDEEIIERLTSVRGIGRWTVEMLLIFRLGRADVLPIHDYGVRKGFALTIGPKDPLPTPKQLESYGKRWAPFRSIAAWYLWRANELPENIVRKKNL